MKPPHARAHWTSTRAPKWGVRVCQRGRDKKLVCPFPGRTIKFLARRNFRQASKTQAMAIKTATSEGTLIEGKTNKWEGQKPFGICMLRHFGIYFEFQSAGRKLREQWQSRRTLAALKIQSWGRRIVAQQLLKHKIAALLTIQSFTQKALVKKIDALEDLLRHQYSHLVSSPQHVTASRKRSELQSFGRKILTHQQLKDNINSRNTVIDDVNEAVPCSPNGE